MRSVVVAVAFCVATACSLSPNASSNTATPSGSPPGHLDAQVPMPPAFPHDIPVYPGARLIAAAGFPSPGYTSWGMEWETLDPVAKVQSYYAQNLNKGDWTVNFTVNSADQFAATFARKSNSHASGTLAANRSQGVTKILVSLLSPAS